MTEGSVAAFERIIARFEEGAATGDSWLYADALPYLRLALEQSKADDLRVQDEELLEELNG